MKYELIVNPPNEKQIIIQVSSTGGYFDQSLIIWDERLDGSIPVNMKPHIGYLIRVGDSLEIDDSKRVEYEERLAQAAIISQQVKDKKDADALTMSAILLKLGDGTAKLEDVVEYLKIKEGL